MARVVPRDGPCAPWITGSDVMGLTEKMSTLDEEAADEIAMAVSNLLYRFSGEQFTGQCGPVTVRPRSRPSDADTRGQAALFASGGYMGSWGVCCSYGQASMGAASHYGCTNPPEVDLGAYPISEVTEVKIDGTVIPANEYRLSDYRRLMRVRTSATAVPTERWGWPTCQIDDLPDTEPGTFSVTFTYGQPPPADGVLAAKALSKAIGLQSLGLPNELPTRLQTINRQNISMTVLDIMDYVAQGRTGIWQVDIFTKSVNPTGSTKKALVWSPDTGRARRMPR